MEKTTSMPKKAKGANNSKTREIGCQQCKTFAAIPVNTIELLQKIEIAELWHQVPQNFSDLTIAVR